MEQPVVGAIEVSSSPTLAPQRAFEQWEAVMADAVAPSVIEPLAEGPWRGHLSSAQFDSFAVSRMQASAQRALRTGRHVARSNEEFLLVNIMLEGTNWTEQGGRIAVSTPGTITFFDSGLPLESHTSNNSVSAMVRAPMQLVLDHAGLNRDQLPTAAAIPATGGLGVIAGFFRGLAELPTGEVDNAVAVLASDAPGMLASAVLLTIGKPALSYSDTQTLRQQVISHVRKHFMNPELTVDEIARACLISRRTLYRVCDGFGGPGSILRRIRIEHARRLLRSDPRRALTGVAAACGFSTDRHFYRAFKEETGLTPGQFRDQQHCKTSVLHDSDRIEPAENKTILAGNAAP
ncbi:AraC family transcriptional regulator [Nocardia sp. NPDC058058]|uniref:AraC family transcriptional regulator n=1 Tax=Nocardia sp. NPDC058058 TaxID=3346317 RepID=UPI0036DB2918